MTFLRSKSYTFDPRPNYPLLSTAKCYWNPSSPSFSDSNALTLILTHGTGFHKEQWEPTIDDLYDLLDAGGSVKVREIWSIDAPNHGDAATLNENALGWGYDQICAYIANPTKSNPHSSTSEKSDGKSMDVASMPCLQD
jgi:hypothetical protein